MILVYLLLGVLILRFFEFLFKFCNLEVLRYSFISKVICLLVQFSADISKFLFFKMGQEGLKFFVDFTKLVVFDSILPINLFYDQLAISYYI